MTLTVRRTGASDYGRFIKALICGDPGAGKTLISSTFPNPLFASAEGGLMSIADRNVPYAEIRSSQALLEVKNTVDQLPEVREKLLTFPVDTVVIDTIDEVQRILIRERLEETKKESMALPDWGWLGEQMQAIIRGFRNLDLNVVFTCHIKETTDAETGKLYLKPGLQGAIGDQIPAYVDLALLLKSSQTTKIVGGESVKVTNRVLQTYPDGAHPWVKDRSGKLEPEVLVNFDDDYKRLSAAIFSGLDEMDATKELAEIGQPTVVTPTPAPTAAEPPPAKRQGGRPKKAEATAVNPPVSATAEAELPLTAVNSPSPDSSPEPALADVPRETPVEAGLPPCEECGGAVESADQADFARIRFRKVLCRSCFTNAKAK